MNILLHVTAMLFFIYSPIVRGLLTARSPHMVSNNMANYDVFKLFTPPRWTPMSAEHMEIFAAQALFKNKIKMQTALKVNVETHLGVRPANQIFAESNWSFLRYYHSIFCGRALSLSSSASRHRPPRIGTPIVFRFVCSRETVTLWSI